MEQFTIDEIAKIRADTPGVRNVVHFNNAGSALMPQQVLQGMLEYLQLEASIGGYEAAEKRQDNLQAVYASAAKLIGAEVDEIAVTENATRAWDMAFYSIPFKAGDRILTAKASYASNFIAFLQTARNKGVTIDVIPDDEHGQLSVTALEQMLDHSVRLVAVTHVPTNGGLVNPAAEVGRVIRQAAHRQDLYYLLDACQSVGQMPMDVNKIGCDMLSATARKFLRGPRGMGFLYVKKDRIAELQPPMLDLHAATWSSLSDYEIRPDAKRFENWERNYTAKLGMGLAIDYALGWGIDKIWNRVLMLSGLLRQRLSELPGVYVQDKGLLRCGIVTFSVDGMRVDDVKALLKTRGINVSTSTRFSTRLDMEERGLDELVRASLHYYNTEEEIEQLCGELRKIITDARM